jgi:phosphoribosylanthranilate isomerase
MIAVKICGLNNEDAVSSIIEAGADYAGFVYYPRSARHVSIAQAAFLKNLLPQSIKSVMVVVNPPDDLLEEIKITVNPDFFQLHGEETAERIAEIRSKFPDTGIIKALPVANSDDVKKAEIFNSPPDFFLFDAKPTLPGMMHGGNGTPFDWRLLEDKKIATPWFLSGGLNALNVAHAIKYSGAKFIDVSSGVEASPGVKDAGLIKQFVKAVRECC